MQRSARGRRAKSFEPAGYTPGKFRAEAVEPRSDRPTLSATVAERCIARQMASAERARGSNPEGL